MRLRKPCRLAISLLSVPLLAAAVAMTCMQVASAGCSIGWNVFQITCDKANDTAGNYDHVLSTEFASQNRGTWVLAQGIACGGTTGITCAAPDAPTATPSSTTITEDPITHLASGAISTTCDGKLANGGQQGTSSLSAWDTGGQCDGVHDVIVKTFYGTCP